MSRRTFYLIPVLSLGALLPTHAATVVCSLQTGNSGPFVNQACDQQLASPTTSLNWGSVLGATSGPLWGPIHGSVGGDGVTLTSNQQFEGADNTALAWNGTNWMPAGFVSNATTFAGHFNSATTPTGPAPEPMLGDNLLGLIAPSGASMGNTHVTMQFDTTINFIEFQVTARVGRQGTDSTIGQNTNFTATLMAFDSFGNVLGTYKIDDQGTGGTCAGLSNIAGPQTCSDAPSLQFYDPESRIKSVQLFLDDPTGGFLDTLQVGGPVPEPSSFGMLGIGLIALLWAAKRGKLTGLVSAIDSARQ